MASEGNGLSDLKYLSDLVLVSSDDTEFHVHKVVLAKASSVFNGMFSSCFAQPDNAGGTNSTPNVKGMVLANQGDKKTVRTFKMTDVSSEGLTVLLDLLYLTPGKVKELPLDGFSK